MGATPSREGVLRDVVLAAKTRGFLLQKTDPSVRYSAPKDLCDRPEGDSQVTASGRRLRKRVPPASAVLQDGEPPR